MYMAQKAKKKSKLRHAEYYDMQKTFDSLYADSKSGEVFGHLMDIISAPSNIKLVSLMRRSSNNLNQLTRKVHETGRVYNADLEDISQRQEQLWEGVKEILTQLSKLS